MKEQETSDKGKLAQRVLSEGKLPQHILNELLVFTRDRKENKDIIVGAETGEDAAVVYGLDRLIISADPITFTEENIGIYTVAVNCNDIVAMGGIPKYLTTTVLIPIGTHLYRLKAVFKEIGTAAKAACVNWVGGHTEVTTAVNRIIVSGHVVGFLKGKATPSSGAKAEEDIVMTKWAGMEGTTLIAREFPEKTKTVLGNTTFKEVENWLKEPGISIIKEGQILEGIEISAAHDPTEGGIATGIHEICMRSGTGAVISKESILLRRETSLLTEAFGIDPLGLLSSGVLLFTASHEEALKAVSRLRQSGIDSAVIGKITDREGEILIKSGKDTERLPIFTADEIIKALKRKV
ncbi:MAG: hypothetical protein J7K04_09245 [Spirochaetales bacterium]|nr:hypothetical protein [Spirochaetales bacterium]